MMRIAETKGKAPYGNYIKIGKPRIVNDNCSTKQKREEVSRLEADSEWCFEGEIIKKTIFYEVDTKYGKYLSDERSDAFILALVELGMQKKADIYYDAPMSEDLKYQLENHLIPVYAKNITGMYRIQLYGSFTDEPIETEGVAGTGFSAGVDSFYSVLKHKDSEYKSRRVTHLVLAVNGAANTGYTEEIDREWYDDEMKRFKPLAEEMGLELIGIYSNVSLISKYKTKLRGGGGIVTSSFVHALRKLFGTYYWASGYSANEFKFDDIDSCYMEMFYIPLMSTCGLRFYVSGLEVNRPQKVAYIADFPVVQKGLTVCGGIKNCGICPKCTRTMAELYSLGKLEKFGSVFPVKEYMNNYPRKMARELAQDHPPFTTDIIDSMKKNGKRIPVSSYVLSVLYYKPFFFLKKHLRNNHFFMNLYYNNGWKERLGEGKVDERRARARFEGIDK